MILKPRPFSTITGTFKHFNYLLLTKIMEVRSISPEQQLQLDKVVPSENRGTLYYPCQVTLTDGTIIDNVYIMEHQSYLRSWVIMPDVDRGKQHILIENVLDIRDSPNRLPVKFANELYKAGESGMGYIIFKILYDNGSTMDTSTGNAVDFVPSPDGLTTKNIVDVLPHRGSRENFVRPLGYYWCLYKKKRNRGWF